MSVCVFDISKSEPGLCSYVQWVESGGARVVPVVIGRSQQYYNQVSICSVGRVGILLRYLQYKDPQNHPKKASFSIRRNSGKIFSFPPLIKEEYRPMEVGGGTQ